MNPRKFSEKEYIDFLIATQMWYSCCETADVQPEHKRALAHDAVNRILERSKSAPEAL